MSAKKTREKNRLKHNYKKAQSSAGFFLALKNFLFPKSILKALLVNLSLLFFLVFLISLMVVLFSYVDTDFDGQRYMVVVPGAGITKNSEPSDALKMRLDKALDLYHNQQVKKVFISGRSFEVLVMNKYLLDNGVNSSDIIEDINGANTYCTVINSKNYLTRYSIKSGVVFVSQKFHIPRIALLANRHKISKAEFLCVDKKNVRLKKLWLYTVRESLALIKVFFISR